MVDGHGDDTYNYSNIRLNFSSNIYCQANNEALEQHLKSAIHLAISAYPEPQPLRLESLISQRLGISNKEICVTAGATEAIYLIAQAYRGSYSTICEPTFSEYADACRIHGHQLVSERFPCGKKLHWLCNPNNPTGKTKSKQSLLKAIGDNPHDIFIIDHSYKDFTLCSLLTDREAVDLGNVILINSMTKRHAIPGLRLGYITASEELTARIRSGRMPWSVNSLAIEAGLFITSHPSTISLKDYLEEASRLRHELNAIPGIEVFDSDTHFFLARVTARKASELKDYLAKEHGILIRDASNFEGLNETYFRITSRTPKDNRILAAAIRNYMNKIYDETHITPDRLAL